MLLGSLVLNLCAGGAALVLVGRYGRGLRSRLRRGGAVAAGLQRAPALPYRAEHQLSMTKRVGGLEGEALEGWRSDVLTELRALLDLPPVPAGQSLDWETQPTRASTYTLDRATVPSPLGRDRLVMYRLLPTRRPPHGRKPAAVLAVPGTGERALDGLLGRVDNYENRAAVRLAERGYAVYAAETFGIGERGFDPGWLGARGYHSQHVAGMYGLYSGDYLSRIFLADLEAELRVIEADPAVDSEEIATFGISRGASLAMLAAALHPEVKGAVAASGVRDEDLYSASYFDHAVIPGQGRYFLQSDLAGTIAPRPVLITYGSRFTKRGAFFGESAELQEEVSTLRTAKRTESIYRMFGASTELAVVLHPLGHTWDEDSTLAFLGQLFGY